MYLILQSLELLSRLGNVTAECARCGQSATVARLAVTVTVARACRVPVCSNGILSYDFVYYAFYYTDYLDTVVFLIWFFCFLYTYFSLKTRVVEPDVL